MSAIEAKILEDITAWTEQHGVDISVAAATDAMQQIAEIHRRAEQAEATLLAEIERLKTEHTEALRILCGTESSGLRAAAEAMAGKQPCGHRKAMQYWSERECCLYCKQCELEQAVQQLTELVLHTETDGIAACLALQQACVWIGLGKRPDEATIERWKAALQPFAGNALLLERAAAHRLANAAAAWFVARSAAGLDTSGQLKEALTYASDQLSAALMAYERARAITPPATTPQSELEQARADAAALRRQVRIWRQAIDGRRPRLATDAMNVLAQLAQTDHPGAALLVELEAARTVVAAARVVRAALPGAADMHERLVALSSALAAYDEAVKASDS